MRTQTIEPCKGCRWAAFCKFCGKPETTEGYICEEEATSYELLTSLIFENIKVCNEKGFPLPDWVWEFYKSRQFDSSNSISVLDDADLIDELIRRHPDSKIWQVEEGDSLEVTMTGPSTVIAL